MMGTPYIAGPWGHDRRIIFADGAAIAEMFSGACRSLAEADATERLIAAAPVMHEALRTALVVVAGCNAGGVFDAEERAIRAALDQAEGESA